MQIPDSFRDFADNMHQDSVAIYGSLEAAVADYFGGVADRKALAALDNFLTWLLTDEDQRNGLKILWRKVNDCWRFSKKKAAVAFFEYVQAQVRLRLDSLP